jgi:hypothetical protein
MMDISEEYRRGFADAKREAIWLARKFEDRNLLNRGITAQEKRRAKFAGDMTVLESWLGAMTPEQLATEKRAAGAQDR